jgi:hypothetical protein
MSDSLTRGDAQQTIIESSGEPIQFCREPSGAIRVTTVIHPSSSEYPLWNSLFRLASRFEAEGTGGNRSQAEGDTRTGTHRMMGECC